MNRLVKLSHHNRYTDNSVMEGGEKFRKRRRYFTNIASKNFVSSRVINLEIIAGFEMYMCGKNELNIILKELAKRLE